MYENNQLIENFYHMLLLFKYYNIIPVFVFDGKINTDKIEDKVICGPQ